MCIRYIFYRGFKLCALFDQPVGAQRFWFRNPTFHGGLLSRFGQVVFGELRIQKIAMICQFFNDGFVVFDYQIIEGEAPRILLAGFAKEQVHTFNIGPTCGITKNFTNFYGAFAEQAFKSFGLDKGKPIFVVFDIGIDKGSAFARG